MSSAILTLRRTAKKTRASISRGQGLAAAGIGLWPGELPEDNRVLFEPGDRDRGISIIQRGLADLGYGASVTGCLDDPTQAIIRAMQRRYRPARIDGIIDMQRNGNFETVERNDPRVRYQRLSTHLASNEPPRTSRRHFVILQSRVHH